MIEKPNHSTPLRWILLLFLFVLLLGCSEKKQEEPNSLQNILDSVYSKHPDLIGIMAHIEAPDKKISWSGAKGLTDKNDTISIRSTQPFLLSSITKTYVAAAILRLVEQHRLSLTSTLDTLLSEKTTQVLKRDEYALSTIQIKHLLSHTSGISNYAETKLFEQREHEQPGYHWTREEQILLAVEEGSKLYAPEEGFHYSDTNYLLLTEIIEQITGDSFYIAIRKLLDYERHEFSSTWFYGLEKTPTHLPPRIHQYHGTFDSYTEHPSFDLYGGGGLAATAKDLAVFTQLLFTDGIFEKKETKDMLYTEIVPKGDTQNFYRFGIQKMNIAGITCYGHDGFFGSFACYIPEYNASIAICISNADKQNELVPIVLSEIVKQLQK